MATLASDEGVVNLVSREGEEFEVPIAVAKMSQLVAEAFDGDDEDSDDEGNIKTIPLPNVSSQILKLVIDYGEHYQDESMTPIQTPLKSSRLEDLVQPWYVSFVSDIEEKVLFDLVAAANFMDIKPLLDLACLEVSILIKRKSPEELRLMFKVNVGSGASENAQPSESAN